MGTSPGSLPQCARACCLRAISRYECYGDTLRQKQNLERHRLSFWAGFLRTCASAAAGFPGRWSERCLPCPRKFRRRFRTRLWFHGRCNQHFQHFFFERDCVNQSYFIHCRSPLNQLHHPTRPSRVRVGGRTIQFAGRRPSIQQCACGFRPALRCGPLPGLQ